MTRKRKVLWFVSGAVLLPLLAIALAVAFLPWLLPMLPSVAWEYDLGPKLKEKQRALFPDAKVKVRCRFVKGGERDIVVHGKGSLLGHPFSLRLGADYSLLRRRADASFSWWLEDAPWQVEGTFSGTTADGWIADAHLPPTAFDEKDPLLRDLVPRLATNVTDLAYSGRFGFEVHASTTNALPLATWSAAVNLADFSASCEMGEKPVTVERLRLRAGADGLGKHVDVRPAFPRADRVVFKGFTMTNVFASLRPTETAVLVTEAGADLLGGRVRLYSFFLDPAKLNAGVTVFLDDIDTGAALGCVNGFRGSATGRLHGKIPIHLRNGEEVSFGDAYLYSVPGETGEIRVEDPEPIVANLEAAGTSRSACDNFRRVLEKVDYSSLNVTLDNESADSYALSFKLQGSATRGEKTVPVTLAITLHGDLGKLINTGLRAKLRKQKP